MLRIPAIRSSEGKPERDPAARRARLRRDAGPAGVTVLGLSLEHGSTASAITGGGSEPTAALGAEDGSRFRARTVHRTGGLGDAGYGMRLRCGRVSHPTSRISHLGAERRARARAEKRRLQRKAARRRRGSAAERGGTSAAAPE